MTSPFDLFVDMEARVEQLKASEVDMKNLFYREKDALEVLEYDYKQLAHECNMHMELRIASDRDLVNCYKSLQKLGEDCEKLWGQLKELEEAGRTKDCSIGRSAEGSPWMSGDVCQASGEVHPQPGLSVHEVVLPQSPG
jgi:hypothetical protein